jgi:hypothetical protein
MAVFYIPPENIGSLGRLPSDQQFTGALESLPFDEMQNPPLQLAGLGRRAFLKGLAAVAGTGAIRKLPVDKIDEVAPVAKAKRLTIPKNFNILRDLPNTKRLIDDYVSEDLSVQFGDIDDIDYEELEELIEQTSDSERFGIADTFDDVRRSMKEELTDIYGLSDKEADGLMKKEGFDLPVSKSEEIDRIKSFSGSFNEYKSEYPNSPASIDDWFNAGKKSRWE